jgi:formylglycine-generating enzyme required for sulfatase activity
MTGDWPFRILPRFFLAFALVTLAAVGCAVLQQRRPGRTFRDCDDCPEMVIVPPGSFLMGDSAYGHPQHRVTIRSAFAVAKDMVTRDEYGQFVGESRYSIDNSWQNPSFPQTGSHPVVNVNWDDAQAYVGWLSGKAGHQYRLLSESEYEYAERAGSTTMFWWGDEAAPVCQYANYHECASAPARVGAYRSNVFGLDDMTGNTFEWVEDCWHPDYHGAPSDGTAWTSSGCSSRVMRGMPWFMVDPTPLRSSRRDTSDSGNRSDVIGFRVARNL